MPKEDDYAVSGGVFVITGASSGIGRAIAAELGGAGAKLVLTARRGSELEEIARELPTECAIVAGDITDEGMAGRLIDAGERLGSLRGLVNNAGALAMGAVGAVDAADIRTMIRVNFEAVVELSHAFGHLFKARGGGTILNITSVAAYGAGAELAAYAGSKAAVEAFSQSLRIELGPYGVKVCTLAPGATDTPMQMQLRQERGLPMTAPAMRPEHIARTAHFILSQPSEVTLASIRCYLTGQPR